MRAVLVLALLVPVMASATTSYLCATEKAAGVSFDKTRGTWDTAIFKADGKYLVSQATPAELAESPAKWHVKKLGQSFSMYGCPEDFSNQGRIYCRGIGEFKFNKENGRFLRTYTLGYYNDTPGKVDFFGAEGENTPAVEIGKCSPIN
ncbi:MAG: hypothetical protein QUV35_03175 [Hydrogenophaga sp.]|uniref:hypothetical protein n=1 Tax=Hydrogenophaga sp. TaxID=1904254 RepID=UPI0026178866|nr:hypothetical protein [Hydrogenophaga sp.]MDM7941609.1 hypothetical protein [Hydrogenophaga sp.]